MSVEEIRWWMCELRRRGWTRGVMARTLGFERKNWRKADGKEAIYPSEQVRFSRQLRRIISGELVLKPQLAKSGRLRRSGNRYGGRSDVPVYDAVLAEHPEPLRMPMKMHFDMRTGRIGLTPQFMPPENPLPNFKTLLDSPKRWSWWGSYTTSSAERTDSSPSE